MDRNAQIIERYIYILVYYIRSIHFLYVMLTHSTSIYHLCGYTSVPAYAFFIYSLSVSFKLNKKMSRCTDRWMELIKEKKFEPRPIRLF